MSHTLKNFIESTNIPAPLVRSVVRQLGGWNVDTWHNLNDISNHGIDGGFGGFIYYVATTAFFKRNRKHILEMAQDQAKEFGTGMLEMIMSFGCIKKLEGIDQDEIARAIYKGKGECVDQIMNCLAWYAGEEVARAYVDFIERGK